MTVFLQVPLPFGYHLDLDFLRVCSDELVSGETLQKLKELKRQRRKERKQLEALMGITQVLLEAPLMMKTNIVCRNKRSGKSSD